MPEMSPPDFRPVDCIDGDYARGILLLGDHSGRALPPHYGDLGLPAAEFDRHIAYDIGVERLVRTLASLLGAPAALATFSRLLIDANRGEDDPTLIRQIYDGSIIPANYPISAEERETRLVTYHRPYHAEIARMIDRATEEFGRPPMIISLHSFTPVLRDRIRPWQAGILWDMDDRVARPLIDMLEALPGMVVGDNEPYDGALKGDTMYRHAVLPGLAHALIEIRQDLIADDAGGDEWATRLAPMLDAINARDDIHEARFFGTRAD